MPLTAHPVPIISRPIKTLLIALACCGGLVGCSAQPGTALVIEGKTYSESQIETATHEANDLLKGIFAQGKEKSAQAMALNRTNTVSSLMTANAADDKTLGENPQMRPFTSPQEFRKALETIAKSQGADPRQVNEASDETIDVMRGFFLGQQRNLDPRVVGALTEKMSNSQTTWSPRYGKRDEQGQVRHNVPSSVTFMQKQPAPPTQ